MLPIRDSIPNVYRPWAVYGLIAANLLVFVWQQGLTQGQQAALFMTLGVVPARFLEAPAAHAASGVAYMFLHGGLGHFLLNMWVMWIFADNVEDVMGSGRFLLFYFLCGLAALAGHLAFNPASAVPVVGASGAIAGVMGAYLILYPHGRVEAVVPIFIFPYFLELPAALFLTIWFAIQLFSGLAVAAADKQGGVAFMAHAAGFVAGVALLPFFRRPERCHYCFNRSERRYERNAPGQEGGPRL